MVLVDLKIGRLAVQRKSVLLLLLFLTVPGLLWGQSARSRVKAGNKLFTEEKYDQALNKYQDALLSQPVNKRIQFNIGDTFYQKKKYEEALQEYQKVIGTDELRLEEQSYYNLGNTLYRLEKLPESILAYQQALKLDPNDVDAKYNLEYVRRKLKENANKQQQNPQQQQQQEQQQQDQNKDQQNQKQQQEQQQQAQNDPQKLSKEDAERILNALKNDEKDIQKKRKMQVPSRYQVEKDW